MELKLEDRDYVPDERGGLETVSGTAALLQRVLLKLSARRGSFPFLPKLGSRLYLLGREPKREREQVAESYVREALSDEEAVQVTGVTLTELDQERLAIRVSLSAGGQALGLTLETAG